jgi:hypothetical protein
LTQREQKTRFRAAAVIMDIPFIVQVALIVAFAVLAIKLIIDNAINKVFARLSSNYRSGNCKDWLKFKNPDAPALKREAEEDWGRRQIAKR